jgi:hypothetical protein
MVVSIHQPDYISYLGYFYKISKSDVFVFLDDCQFSNDNMHHWNRIKTPQGECRLKIPVEQHLGDLIKDVRTRDELGWKEKHLKTIEMNYSRAKYFGDFFPAFRELLSAHYDSLASMNTAINTEIAHRFGFTAKMLNSSELGLDTVREQRVIDIVKLLGGDTYISGHGAKAYQVDEHFEQNGIKLVYTDYTPIEYTQQWKKAGFLPCMSVLDYIFNCGFDWDCVERAVEEKKKAAD